MKIKRSESESSNSKNHETKQQAMEQVGIETKRGRKLRNSANVTRTSREWNFKAKRTNCVSKRRVTPTHQGTITCDGVGSLKRRRGHERSMGKLTASQHQEVSGGSRRRVDARGKTQARKHMQRHGAHVDAQDQH